MPGGALAAAAAAAQQVPGPVLLQYERLVPALLLKRYKRFLGDVALGATAAAGAAPAAGAAAATVIHVPNTGSMTGLLEHLPAEALLSVSSDPKRKYAHTLEQLRLSGQGAWVGVHSAKANAMVRALLEQRLLPAGTLPPYHLIQPEVKFGDGKSRVDFVLHPPEPGHGGGEACEASSSGQGPSRGSGVDGAAPKRRRTGKGAAASAAAAATPSSRCCFMEVKSVTLAEDRADGSRIALFPDTVSKRAQRHVQELTAVAAAGGSAALLFCVQRGDCSAFAPCVEKDPEYAALVQQAVAAGVRVVAVEAALDAAGMVVRYGGLLPCELGYKQPAAAEAT